MVSLFAGRASPLAVSAPPSNGEATVPFAPEGVMFFIPSPIWCARDREELARPRRRRTLPVTLRPSGKLLFFLLFLDYGFGEGIFTGGDFFLFASLNFFSTE